MSSIVLGFSEVPLGADGQREVVAQLCALSQAALQLQGVSTLVLVLSTRFEEV